MLVHSFKGLIWLLFASPLVSTYIHCMCKKKKKKGSSCHLKSQMDTELTAADQDPQFSPKITMKTVNKPT